MSMHVLCSSLSPTIMVQFTLELCAATENRIKISLKPLIMGVQSTSFRTSGLSILMLQIACQQCLL